jgi:lysophospholipid acyltransferase (LPLAT)-like uncharacterized protein
MYKDKNSAHLMNEVPETEGGHVSFKQKLICRLAYYLIRAIDLTCRHRYVGEHHLKQAARDHPQGVVAYAFWHEHAVACFMSQKFRRIAPMISLSGDGEIAAFTAQRFGMQPVRGSSSHGGRGACEHYAPLVAKGYAIALTVDGPRGPRHVVKPGIVYLASRYQAAVLPFVAKADRSFTLSSWDRMKIPKPFSLITSTWGEPIAVPAEVEKNELSSYQTLVARRLEQLES